MLMNDIVDSQANLICVKCRKPALGEKPVELLPDGGTLIKAIHPDSSECTWAEYDTIEGVMKRKKEMNPKIIVCPSCSTKGRINYYSPNKNKKENVVYFMVHEPIGGEWGKKGKVKRVRRCYISDPKQRDIILKKLGRYIEK